MQELHRGDYVKIVGGPRYLVGHVGVVERVVGPGAVGVSVAALGDPRAIHWLSASALKRTPMRAARYAANPRRTIKLSETIQSVLETDVLDLAEDPREYGLNREETFQYRALASSVEGNRLIVPDAAAEQDAIADLLIDLANGYDDELETGRSNDPRFAARARRLLGELASKVRQ